MAKDDSVFYCGTTTGDILEVIIENSFNSNGTSLIVTYCSNYITMLWYEKDEHGQASDRSKS